VEEMEIKQHVFFEGINWEALGKKEIEAEWKPNIRDYLESGNVDDETEG
jgi:hypothetical protein